MSRTFRRRLPGWNPGEKVYENNKAAHKPGYHPGAWTRHPYHDFRKDHWCHGRDAYKGKIAIHDPWNGRIKGYGGFDEVWGERGKRRVKKLAGRIRRRYGLNEIKLGLRDHAEAEDVSVAQR